MKIKYGPYIRGDKRMQVEVEYSDGTVKSMLYSRHLLEVELNRQLSSDEHVDHDDGNKLNDNIRNLQILSVSENAAKDAVRVDDIYVKCVWCDTLFKLSNEQRKRALKRFAGPFCSRQCSGRYGKAVQMGTIQKLVREDFTVNYYKQSGAPLSDAQKKHLNI